MECKTRQRHGLCFQGAYSQVEEMGLVMSKDDQQPRVTYMHQKKDVEGRPHQKLLCVFSEKTSGYVYLCPDHIIN